jgi:hypothetical protein
MLVTNPRKEIRGHTGYLTFAIKFWDSWVDKREQILSNLIKCFNFLISLLIIKINTQIHIFITFILF